MPVELLSKVGWTVSIASGTPTSRSIWMKILENYYEYVMGFDLSIRSPTLPCLSIEMWGQMKAVGPVSRRVSSKASQGHIIEPSITGSGR